MKKYWGSGFVICYSPDTRIAVEILWCIRYENAYFSDMLTLWLKTSLIINLQLSCMLTSRDIVG